MVKKRAKMKPSVSSSYFFFPEKRGQITIFIILGLLMLFAALFVMKLAKETKVGELEQEQESVLGKVFSKEGLRIYVDDCLKDGLPKGLNLLGKHGRIPKEDGGTAEFNLGITGIYHPQTGEEIFYAITGKKHFPDEQYPCLDGKEPAFCKYEYPNSSILPGYKIKFGETQLSISSIEWDLENYLKSELAKCMSKKILDKLNGAGKIKTTKEDIKIELSILDAGIKANVNYPLKLVSAGEEFFHLETFDLPLYKSEFKKFLESAVTRPINFDQSFVDFKYNEMTLKSSIFKHRCFIDGEASDCTKALLPITGLAIKQFDKKPAPNGDDLFNLKVSDVIKGESYYFNFARQN